MEVRAGVEPFLDHLPNVPRGDRHLFVEELDLHVAHRRLEQDRCHAPAIRDAYVKGGLSRPIQLRRSKTVSPNHTSGGCGWIRWAFSRNEWNRGFPVVLLVGLAVRGNHV